MPLWILFILFQLIFSTAVISQNSKTIKPLGEEIKAKRFHSSAVDKNNVIWFVTDAGIINYNGSKWELHSINEKIDDQNIKGLQYESYQDKNDLWIAGSKGATVVSEPLKDDAQTKTYTPDNSQLAGSDIISIAISKKGTRWFATENGISALVGDNWLKNNYEDIYPIDLFEYFPISTMDATDSGDTLYVGTYGAGVMRFFQDNVDAVSGASEYAAWGPILMPSDSVFSIYISPDGTQWIGTDMGIAKHTGHNTLENWEIFDTDDGLAHNRVQAINADQNGVMYFGTKNGLSVFNGSNWTTYQKENGLTSNDILTIAIDHNNLVWLGTNDGVNCLKNGEIIPLK